MTAEQGWDAELQRLAEVPPLLQSWAWGEVQAHAGWGVERVKLTSGLATVLSAGRRVRHAYVPRGPVPSTAAAAEELTAWARSGGFARLRVEPDAPPDLGDELRRLGFRPRPDASPQQPVHTSIVGLTPEEDRLLGGFKPKTRYNIRLAERRGVEVEVGADTEELGRQSEATARRQGIRLPPRSYYARLLSTLPWCHTYVARHEGDPLAAILVARHAGRAYYLYGGSNGMKRELMPMYAAQWAAIRDAAAAGLGEYDLWGVPPPGDPDHPWHGLEQFKAGFRGREVAYCGVWETVLRPREAAVLEAREQARASGKRLVSRFLNNR